MKRNLQNLSQSLKVTNYLDYREYLRDLYELAKDSFESYSYLVFAEDLGFSPINMIRLVIARQRLLAEKSAQTIVKTLDLRRAERKYFLALVQHINARSPKQRDFYFHKMLEAKQESVVSHHDRNQMEYFSAWYHSVIYEMLRLDHVEKTAVGLARNLYPGVTVDKIQKSLALLESIGLIKLDHETGFAYRLSNTPIILPEDATAGQLSITKYHQEMIDAAKEAVATVPTELREFNALTISLSEEAFGVFTSRLRSLCAEALALENAEKSRELVAQLNIQFFTLTKKEDESKESERGAA